MSEPIVLRPLRGADAEAILAWRYAGQYAIYDPGAGDLPTLIDPANRFFAVLRGRELIGHVCLGAEARVPGLEEAPDADDLGFGLRPDLVGRGNARRLLPELLAVLAPVLARPQVRVVIAAWNERARAAARRAGFQPAGELENANGRYVVLTRPAPPP